MLQTGSQKAHHDKIAFGGNREIVIKRDGEKCVRCGMTREEHKAKYGRDITVDHIDGNGVGKPVHLKNNDPSNLQTLCYPCHESKDHIKKLTPIQVINIRHLKGVGITQKEIAKLYGVHRTYIGQLWNNKWRKIDCIGESR